MRRRRSWGGCARGSRPLLAALEGQPRRLSLHESLRSTSYFVIMPQAMRSPELPEGSVL
jgi:hypothetical protein